MGHGLSQMLGLWDSVDDACMRDVLGNGHEAIGIVQYSL